MRPSSNQAVGSTAGAGLVLVWLLGQFGVDMPAEVAVAAVAGLSWLAGVVFDDRKLGRRELGRPVDRRPD